MANWPVIVVLTCVLFDTLISSGGGWLLGAVISKDVRTPSFKTTMGGRQGESLDNPDFKRDSYIND